MSSIPQVDNIKSSIVTEEAGPQLGSSYVRYCQVCEWYGYPHEKIIVKFGGFRSEEEEGFVVKFAEYDYAAIGETRVKHKHKYNPKLVQEFVDLALKMRISMEVNVDLKWNSQNVADNLHPYYCSYYSWFWGPIY
jgi:hypothetical protein